MNPTFQQHRIGGPFSSDGVLAVGAPSWIPPSSIRAIRLGKLTRRSPASGSGRGPSRPGTSSMR